MKIFNKIKWVGIIAVVFFTVLATNLIDERNFRSISDSIVTIYEDRLVVKNIILDIATSINQKEVAFLTRDSVFLATQNEIINEKLATDLEQFASTKLTLKEEESLNLLQKNIESMIKAESVLIESQFGDYSAYKTIIRELNENLDVLAHIQLIEGRNHFLSGQRKMETIKLFTQIEIYFLILLAMIALIIILHNPKS